jgi:sarcosine oxidase
VEYDVIIAGLGAMGSAAAHHLAARGQRVLGLDRFRPPHTLGSSHGATRIIREAYFEHAAYVPLVRRAYELWQELEKTAARRLLTQTGGLMIGPAAGVIVAGARRSAEEHRLPYETLSAAELRQQYPVLNPSSHDVAIREPRAGILFPERAIQAHLDLAGRNGAHFQFDNPVLEWEPFKGGVRVSATKGSFTGRKLLISTGPWVNSLIPGLRLPLTVERQVMFWFDPKGQRELFGPEKLPIFIWENEPNRFFYGFPDMGDGVKVAVHHQGESVQPDRVRRDVAPREVERAQQLVAQYLPLAAGPLRASTVCLYTNTPDEHFLLDYYPACPQVVIASPCSGHGFKFSPVIGEIAAAMLNDETPQFDLSLFKLGRLLKEAGR